MDRNIGNYVHSAAFVTEVWPGVEWVPLNVLGGTRYTNEEMGRIAMLSAEEKKRYIHTLYEAVQLFQISDFRGKFDNIDHQTDGMRWQEHKTPEDAVRTNCGCCATDTNWLAYFIADVYDEVGSFCYANLDGNGHITTYICSAGEYYFLDMMMCRQDSQAYFGKESGNLEELMGTEWAGFLYRTKDPVNFCAFNIDRFRAKGRSVPFAFYLRETPFVTATGLHQDGSDYVFCIPNQDKPRLIWCEPGREQQVRFVDLPAQW